MKYLVSLYIWIIGFISIGITLIIGIFLSFFLPAKTVDRFVKAGCRVCLWLICIRVDTEGEENIDPEKTYLFMANHVSLFDVPVLEGYIPRYFRGIEADRQFKWPVYGWAVRRFGNISISREDIHSSIRSMKKAGEKLKSGLSIAVMPEGHRTPDGIMRPFKKLPFYLAKEADVPIIPIGLSGLFHLKPLHSWLIRPTRIKVKFGPSISKSVIQQLSVVELRDHVQEKVAALVERP